MGLLESIAYYDSGEDMVFSIRRKSDARFFDFATLQFGEGFTEVPTRKATEEGPPLKRIYTANLSDDEMKAWAPDDYQVFFMLNAGKGGAYAVVEVRIPPKLEAPEAKAFQGQITLTGKLDVPSGA